MIFKRKESCKCGNSSALIFFGGQYLKIYIWSSINFHCPQRSVAFQTNTSATKELGDRPLERIDPGKYTVTASSMRSGRTDVKRHEVLSIDSYLLVDLEAVFSDGAILINKRRNRCVKKW